MTILTGLLTLIIIVIIAAYIGQPFFSEEGRENNFERKQVVTLWEQSRLLEERNGIYADLRSLDFDHEMGKVAADDYKSQRYQLMARGVDSLQKLDALPVPADDPIEAAILSVQAVSVNETAPESEPELGTEFCSQCGQAVATNDSFCGSCGTKVG